MGGLDRFGIVTQGLGKRFDDFWAVHDVTLQVPYGQVLALLGPNGAGKTTTIRMLTAVLQPSRGRAYVAGYSVRHHTTRVRAAVGVLTEQHSLYRRMTAREYLHFFGQLYGLDGAALHRRVAHWLDFFGLGAYRDQRIGAFSKGMRQKLALARALLHEPPVLLLDEPTSAMDPASAFQVRQAIRALRSSRRAIVVCTHNLTEAEQIADRIAILFGGRIVAQGTPEELKARLGPPEYMVQLAEPLPDLASRLDGYWPQLQTLLEITARGEDWFRFRWRGKLPLAMNAHLLRLLLQSGLPVISLVPVPRSLEQVFLEVVRHDTRNTTP